MKRERPLWLLGLAAVLAGAAVARAEAPHKKLVRVVKDRYPLFATEFGFARKGNEPWRGDAAYGEAVIGEKKASPGPPGASTPSGCRR